MIYPVGSVCTIIKGYSEFISRDCTIVGGLMERGSKDKEGNIAHEPFYEIEVQGLDGQILCARHEALRLKKPPRDEMAEQFLKKMVQPLGVDEMEKLKNEIMENEK